MPIVTTKRGVQRTTVPRMYRRSTAAAFCRDMRKEQNRITKEPGLTGVRGEVRLIVIDRIIAENRWARFQEKGA